MRERNRLRLLMMLLVVLAPLPGRAQSTALPMGQSSLFSGSGNCASCHTSNGSALVDSRGTDLSIDTAWRATMMANAAKDPFWQAEVESEVLENPALKDVIETKCATCHMPMGWRQALHDGKTGYSLEEGRADPLALDGVSCTVCHQIQPGNLGTESSFSGGFEITYARKIFGPYENIFPMPMIAGSGYEPVFGEHMNTSELCATCHTLYTPYLDDNDQIAGTFPEQATYLEWNGSAFGAQGVQCQGCHMPTVNQPVKITNTPPGIGTQQPFWRHEFVGANAFMLEILRDDGAEIGVTATRTQFDSTIARTRRQLSGSTATMTVTPVVQDGQLEISVDVRNITGHKFPTGFPSRRAWLHVQVKDAAGRLVFESGAVDSDGRIGGLTGEYEPHHDIITDESQVQIYESVMQDVSGAMTFVLLRASGYLKDNRLPPIGFSGAAENYADMAVHGLAASDPDFNRSGEAEGTGADKVSYRIGAVGQSGSWTVQVDLLYQAIKPAFVDHLFEHDSPAVSRFRNYYDAANKAPELVSTVTAEVNVVTGVHAQPGSDVPKAFALLNNFPNPFNAGTIIEYSVPRNVENITLQILDMQGRVVYTLWHGPHPGGRHQKSWNGRDALDRPVGSGVYLGRLVAGRETLTKKLLVLR